MALVVIVLIVAAIAGVLGTVLELALWGILALVVGTAVVAVIAGRSLLGSSRRA